jgi:hypothetical protein
MNALIFAIASCVAAGSTNYCHLMGQPFVFSSADQCLQTMSARLSPTGHGKLIDGRLYTTQPGASKTWFECEQRPTSQWQTVQAPSQPDTSGAAPFKRVPYVLRHCVDAQCKDSSVTSVSEKACETSKRLVAEYDSSGSYECVKVQ